MGDGKRRKDALLPILSVVLSLGGTLCLRGVEGAEADDLGCSRELGASSGEL